MTSDLLDLFQAQLLKDNGVVIISVSMGSEIQASTMEDYATHDSLHIIFEDFDDATDSVQIVQLATTICHCKYIITGFKYKYDTCIRQSYCLF